MSRYPIHLAVFLTGLAAVCWIGGGYVVSNPLAFAVTLLIGACYVAGALELWRYSQATATLSGAVSGLAGPPPGIAGWLDRLHPSLRNAVRLRVEGERVALPGPALTPYLVGLLVLLGMLGTLLGMVATLRGTGMALESASDLQAIRASLAAPVKGLGFAFGTSIAGVATSAMLGLLSALFRRERIEAAQTLDVRIATTLRVFSQAHQRDEAFRLLQRQSELMPTLVDRLQSMMTAIERQSLALNERQIASQDAFHGKTEAAYTRLASSVEQSLRRSVAESARAAGAALQPVMEATMAGIARETATLHDTVTNAVERQLGGVSSGLESTLASITRDTATLHDTVTNAVERQLGGLTTGLESTLANITRDTATLHDTVTSAVERQLGGLTTGLESTVTKIAGDTATLHETVTSAVARQLSDLTTGIESTMTSIARDTATLHDTVTNAVERQLAGVSTGLESATATLADLWKQALAGHQQSSEALAQDLRTTLDGFTGTFEHRSAGLLDNVAARLDTTADSVSAAWNEALSRQERAGETLAADNQKALSAAAATFEQHSQSLLRALNQSHAGLRTELASRDEERLAAWTASLGSMASALHADWQATSTHAAARQQEICDTLERTARDMTAQTKAHAADTIGEISRLVQAASEAPRAAAEVVAELRQKLSDSMVRDTAMLEERSRLLATLETLLDAVNHASTEQRTAVDALVSTSADLLDRVGTRFTDHVEAETGKLGAVAAQVTGSAVEVASLGEAFGAAVHVFGASNDKLAAHLQRIETALDKSLARSDEQLAYYVAQAREVIDLSMLSQKQIVEELQQLAGQRASAGAEAA
ncbi:DUF802 domain-containing protein [Caballeronia humi]|uniref:Chemotaxis protein n=1 Tax=Caballeronia humi TaxID=326474 RepID=A0A158GR94_9BURK|nr:DUF802 domain-containing protein [Caballeronia humi]SAL34351.1 chemotaxis protein [Caballeronia humi]